jgi:transcription elongation factor Elf1
MVAIAAAVVAAASRAGSDRVGQALPHIASRSAHPTNCFFLFNPGGPMQKKAPVEKPTYAIGDRVEKLCAVCNEERGHVVASVTKRGSISRVTCPKCGTRSSFSSGAKLTGSRSKSVQSEPYDMARTYRTGQVMIHPLWGPGEVTAIIEPRKIDVLFADRIRRLIHSRADA